MIRNNVGTALGLLIAGAAVIAWTPSADPVTLLPVSQLWVEGKSTVKDWKCKAGLVQAAIESQGENPVRLVLAGEKAITTVTLSVPVEKMDCSNGTMNEHMKKALKAKENPTIAFSLNSYELQANAGASKGKLTGTLSIGGTEKPIVLDVDFATTPEGALRVTGTHTLQMTQFGLKPPSLMLGTMKVKDHVVVGFDLQLNR